MNVLIGFVGVGAAILATSLWLAWEPAASAPRVLDRSWVPWARADDGLASIAAALELTIESGGRAASNEWVRLEHRVDGAHTSRVLLTRRGPAWPRFALLPEGDPLLVAPAAVEQRVRALRSRSWSPPFAGWAPPSTEAWDELRLEARRVAAEVELLEHDEGRIEAWIVSASPEQTIVQVRRLMRFASAARPADTGPYR